YFGDLTKTTITKIIEEGVFRMPNPDFSYCKLGVPDRIVQIDETMLNYKCKSQRGLSPTNRTDA
ncbi:hypothetical protein COBT_003469, partial [Conglomerata obtusa]